MCPVKRIKIPPKLDCVGPLSEQMADSVSAAGRDQDLYFRVNLGLTEAITNSIVHGCGGDQGEVEIEYEIEGEDHIFRIFDPGCGPAKNLLISPEMDEDKLSDHHRGLVILQWAADEMSGKLTEQGFCLQLKFSPRP